MPNSKPYENTDECWRYLANASKKARYLGLVGIEQIVDNKNPNPHVHANYNFYEGPRYRIEIPSLNDPEISIWGINNTTVQPYHLEVWCEKSTMDDVLIPVCGCYNANLCTFEGEVSTTACYQLIRRIWSSHTKPTRIFYISDFDPAGNSMPVAMSRKVEWMLDKFEVNCDVRITPVALTAEQVEEYQLPRIPIKESERRGASFEAAFGAGATELDALEAIHPGTLSDLVHSQLETYYSSEAKDEVEEKEEALRQAISDKVEEITSRYSAEIEAIRAMFDEIREIEVDASEYGVKRYDPDVEEDDEDWLFDSGRDYQEQIQRYKAHKKPKVVQ